MRTEQAEILSLQALAWLASEEELWPVFLGATGADAGDLKAALASGAPDPATLAAVLEFLTMDDRWIARFCVATGQPPDAPLRALHALPGAAPVHWT